MAEPRRLPPVVTDYATFVILLSLRFALDLARFPLDGYTRVTPLAVIETQVFYISLHYGLYLLLRINRVPVAAASHVALVVMAVYLFLHLFEYWLYTGGRAAVYAPGEHLWQNLFSAFLATGDAGFWQVMRIFICGAMLLLFLVHRQAAWPRLLLTLPLLYLWGMLLAHPNAWLLVPEPSANEPLVAEFGVRGFIICAWFLLAITMAALLEQVQDRSKASAELTFSGAWVMGFFVLMFWQPMIANGTSAVGLLLLQCGLIAHLAIIAPRPGNTGAMTVGDLVRLVAVALVGAIMATLWGLVGLLGIGLIVWLALERRALRMSRRRCAGTGLLLGAGLGAMWLVLSVLQMALMPPSTQTTAAVLASAQDHHPVLTWRVPCRHRPIF